ncbi:hypothetical protein BFJ68_g16307 [Fusarium oxysporum]|uniref:NmrA-like domain-containing protein n=2 Tax=Fusarium oxysporum TaxID=5507 RepID=A0A420PEX5_FUSOX|nr:hypothetical protein BFJ65_g16789 [Fusarium oxysporum f. sp. cepae]RKK26674.1 hypothetical protein BFJ67_g16529 [Fusarium oxysporum f. sp. cepae]RKK27438.1 hypothetical protein BFJ66_g16652 [Fusarium oxysporum f. sp. cepae]RKK64677.1 hypothetical protein BFJ69_g16621 [Fusarium oxysporum]RKK91034.1 hypothetical protein BFJ68_g16307 [Fusarium oxysporum]
MKVAIVGATGVTGTSIVDALLSAKEDVFEITALVKYASLDKPGVHSLKAKGVVIMAVDLGGSETELSKQLQGQDVVIAAISPAATLDQIPLANAAKLVGVKRFVPCFFAPVTAPKGVVDLRDMKEDVLNHIKKIHLPYTVVDIGWWFQITLPRLPSGRIDFAYSGMADAIPGDGAKPSAFSDNRDVGKYVARAIVDPRTLNQQVFFFSEMLTLNQVYDLLERLSGESIPRKYIPEEEILAKVAKAGSTSLELGDQGFVMKAVYQYWHSWGIRGDNTVEYAQYLGYLLGNDLYPDLRVTSFKDYIVEILSNST